MDSYDYVAVLDFEATCDDRKNFKTQEVIEFPVILLNTSTLEIDAEFHHYIKPVVEPTLTPFCKELTGIQQEWVDNGISFIEALDLLGKFLEKHCQDKKVLFATCGDWDLQTMLRKQCKASRITTPPSYLQSWMNVKIAFAWHIGRKPAGMPDMLNHFNLPLVGRHHSGIDDTRNIAQVIKALVKQGFVLRATSGSSATNATSSSQ